MSDTADGTTQRLSAVSTLPPPAERGTVEVRAAALESIARHVASQVDGVGTASRGLVSRERPKAKARFNGASAFVAVEVDVDWPSDVESVAQRVRGTVRERTSELSGVTVRRADVTVVVSDVPASRRRELA